MGAVLPPSGSPRLTGLFGRAPNDVWAVGGNVLTPDTGGLVVRWDGGAWRQVTAGVPAGPTWNDVWGTAQVEAGQPDLWIVGDGVVLARYR